MKKRHARESPFFLHFSETNSSADQTIIHLYWAHAFKLQYSLMNTGLASQGESCNKPIRIILDTHIEDKTIREKSQMALVSQAARMTATTTSSLQYIVSRNLHNAYDYLE